MNPFIKTFLIAVIATALSGCISPRSYLDPSKPQVTYSDIVRTKEPLPLKLTTVFLRNGEPFPKANSILLDNSSRILRATGLIDPDGPNSVGSVLITVNNIADTAAAAGKGFGTGLTFGLVGSTVQDNYELSLEINANEKSAKKYGIQNGIATAIGNTSIPAGVEPLTTSVAFQKVLEQMILQALKEIQHDTNFFASTNVTLTGTTKQKIEELQGLRKEGLISEKDFQEKRKSLLKQL